MKLINKYSLLMLATILVALTSCSKRDPLYVDGLAGDITGTWIDLEYSDTLYSLRRASHIPSDTDGWTFNKDGTLMARANAGFCGTPPITYADYEGDWHPADSIINIRVGFWGGTMIQKWKVIAITESRLVYYQLEMNTIPEEY